MSELITIVASLIGACGAIIGGFLTYKGVSKTLKHQQKMHDKEMKFKQDEKERIDFINRPELELIEFRENSTRPISKKIIEEAEIELFLTPIKEYKNEGRHSFYYFDDNERENLVTFLYTLRNRGQHKITAITIANNLPRSSSVMNAKRDSHLGSIDEKLMGLFEMYKVDIPPGEKINIAIHFHKDRIYGSSFGSPIVAMFTFDDYDLIWRQDIYAGYDRVTTSRLAKPGEHRSAIDLDIILKCYANPYLW